MKTRLLLVALCLLVAVAAVAQPNPKLKELQYFAGTWTCKGVAFASPWGPEHATKATVTGSWILGNQWMEVHYKETKTTKNPHPYDVRVFMGYDDESKKLVSGSIDNMGSYSTESSTGWEGDTLTFAGPMHGGGATMNTRDVFTKKSATEVQHWSEMEDKGTWKKLDEETCKK